MTTPYSPYMRRSTVWVDQAGRQRITDLTGTAAVGVPATWGAVAACSVADYDHYWQGDVIPLSGNSPTSAVQYVTAGYVLGLQLVDEPGNHHRIFIPAPLTVDQLPKKTVLGPDHINLSAFLSASLNLETTIAGELRDPFTGENIKGISAGWVLFSGSGPEESLIVTTATDLVRRNVQWLDAAGRGFRTILTSRLNADNTMPALANISNAIVRQYWEGTVVRNTTPAPGDAAYWSISDEAVLVFEDATGTQTRLTVPAPKREIFKADGKTVDPTNFNVSSLIAAAISEIIVPASNLPVVNYIGGFYGHSNLYAQ